MSIRLSIAAAALLAAGIGPVLALDEDETRTAILGFYGGLTMVGAVTEYCFDSDGYQPVYMNVAEGWRIRNLPHLDLADAAAATLGGIDAAERTEVEAQAAATVIESAKAYADVGAYCQNLVQVLESGALDLDVYFPDQYARLRAATGE